MSEGQRLILVGLVMGVTCALLVWWLERGAVERLGREASEWLRKNDAFREQYPEGTSGD